jgi:hypothetical protein
MPKVPKCLKCLKCAKMPKVPNPPEADFIKSKEFTKIITKVRRLPRDHYPKASTNFGLGVIEVTSKI